MKKIFSLFVLVLISIITTSCGNNNHGGSTEGNAYADSILQEIRKYDQISLKNNETSVDVYVKKGEKVRSVYDIDNFFYISFVDKNAPEYNGKYFLNHPNGELNEKGELINKSTRFYTVHLDKDESINIINHDYVKTTKRTINIHYIYE